MSIAKHFKKEHNTIQIMSGILGVICDHLEIDDSLAMPRMKTLLGLLKDFLEKNHSVKEEDLYFLAIEDPEMLKDIGPIYLMLEEHNLVRYHIKTMEEQILRYGVDGCKDTTDILRNARNFITFISFHQKKEETIIYPLIEKIVSQQKLEQLIDSYKENKSDSKFYEFLFDLNKIYLKKRAQ